MKPKKSSFDFSLVTLVEINDLCDRRSGIEKKKIVDDLNVWRIFN